MGVIPSAGFQSRPKKFHPNSKRTDCPLFPCNLITELLKLRRLLRRCGSHAVPPNSLPNEIAPHPDCHGEDEDQEAGGGEDIPHPAAHVAILRLGSAKIVK